MKKIIPGNITKAQKAYLIGKRYENEKKLRAGAPEGNSNAKKQYVENHHIDLPKAQRTTRYKLAQEYGINESTVQENEKFAKGLDVLPETEGMSCFATPPCPILDNATEMAKPFDKRPIDWLRLPSTSQFIETLEAVRKSHRSELVNQVNGIGTWLHEDIALEFAR